VKRLDGERENASQPAAVTAFSFPSSRCTRTTRRGKAVPARVDYSPHLSSWQTASGLIELGRILKYILQVPIMTSKSLGHFPPSPFAACLSTARAGSKIPCITLFLPLPGCKSPNANQEKKRICMCQEILRLDISSLQRPFFSATTVSFVPRSFQLSNY
jgi:hypothetical protein